MLSREAVLAWWRWLATCYQRTPVHLRFGGQRLPRTERMLGSGGTWRWHSRVFVPDDVAGLWFGRVWQGAMWVFMFNCLQFQWHAWRPGLRGANVLHMLLALWHNWRSPAVTTLIPGWIAGTLHATGQRLAGCW